MLSRMDLRVLALLTLSSGLWVRCDVPSSLSGAYMPGDVNIAILSPIHAKVTNLHKRTRPHPFVCTDFDLIHFYNRWVPSTQSKKINNSSLLPGLSWDMKCVIHVLLPPKLCQCVEHLLAVNGSLCRHSQQDYSDFVTSESYSGREVLRGCTIAHPQAPQPLPVSAGNLFHSLTCVAQGKSPHSLPVSAG
ncbi:olfactory receptor CB1 [Pimephales promelas]|nr:olfactory receptor CB1 [Pimephales promelas]